MYLTRELTDVSGLNTRNLVLEEVAESPDIFET